QKDSLVLGISGTGELVGYVPLPNKNTNFFFRNGIYYVIPITINNEANTIAEGLNAAATALVGVYEPTSGVPIGFLYQSLALQDLQFPGASETFAFGVNDSTEVVGTFYDSQGFVHGFTWTP